ncbi:DUF1579 family protein [Aquimarina sp. 2201CG5-10]|uniref:DUF1579 family protein n=1 Tax=Aquimarina callyspongiae TaxID=3098150 RepID=UPI002AB420DE|nr:DUF1579 family protein [Aquimarina sp. 2201CG5-10]MDY8136023.1 DUF1579 family protein [Aquimarina sp. 2201CG5-10]
MKKSIIIVAIVFLLTLIIIIIISYYYYVQYQKISNSHFDDSAQPAVELKELDILAGYWEGAGEVFENPNTEATQWTSKVHNKKVFGNHYLQTIEHKSIDNKVQLSTFAFISWDWGDHQYKKMFVNNASNGSKFETMYFLDDKSFLEQYSRIDENGRVIIDQVITKPSDNNYTVIIKRSINGSPAFIYSKGTYTRTNQPNMPQDLESIKDINSLIPLAEGSKWLANMMGGKYKAKAKVESYNFNVNETSTPVLGGNAVVTDYFFEGDDDFTGYNVMTWNEEKQRITGFMLDNRGIAVEFEGVPNTSRTKVIIVLKTILRNTAEVERWIWDVDEEKGMVKSMSHVIHGTSDPVKKITFTFKKIVDFKNVK